MSVTTVADVRVLNAPERSRFEALVQTALLEAGSARLAVLPFCPFVRGYIAGHSMEYLDLVPAELRDSFELAADA